MPSKLKYKTIEFSQCVAEDEDFFITFQIPYTPDNLEAVMNLYSSAHITLLY